MIRSSGATDVYNDFSALNQLRGEAKKNSPQAIKETARQFESIFIQMALKSMRAAGASQESSLMNSSQTHAYRDMYDQQLSLELGKKSKLGLADLVEKQLGGNPDAGTAQLNGKGLDDYRSNTVMSLKQASAEQIMAERNAAMRIVNKLAPAADAQADTGDLSSIDPSDSPESFVKALWPEAQAAASELGVDPKMLLAQAALESNWGRSMVRTTSGGESHNLFGIKADSSWDGKSIASKTLEYEGGVAVSKRAAFRAYDSYADSFKDYVGFLKSNPRYAQALQQTGSPEKFMASLQKAGYATDPHYARKVMSIYHGNSAFESLTAAG